ncbi:MAG TPA: ATP-binding protein [Chloroflexia bacterium]|nr:ATP-binding protein [Chloroflexia bacterium]
MRRLTLAPFNKAKSEKTARHEQLQAGHHLFRQVRLRMTMWYGVVLAIALLLFGVALYFSVQQSLLQPILSEMKDQANAVQHQWITQNTASCLLPDGNRNNFNGNVRSGAPPPGGFPPEGNRFRAPFYLACYDATGSLINSNQRTSDLNSFTNNSAYFNSSLAQKALAQWRQNGQAEATDSIDGGAQTGQIYFYALVVPAAGGQGAMGVIQVSRNVEDLQSALQVLRDLLLILGLVTLVVASAGGLFLAGRALIPTRQAFARQQAFIADASHELRTPLTLLKADAELLMRGSDRLEQDDAELLEDMMSEADQLNNIANNLLELARLDAGKLHLEQDVVELSSMGSSTMRRIKALAIEKKLELQEQIKGKVLVIGDPQLLEQVILILLDNAVKYTPAGGVITLSTGSDAKHAWLQVDDTGVGVAPEHLAHLGERFYRVDKARSREQGGTGLGLALARSIAEQHKGFLDIISTPGEGTSVRLVLPVTRPASGNR